MSDTSKVYARYDGDRTVDYITPEKMYEVSHDDGKIFHAINDDGVDMFCVWEGCAHLDNGDWTRVEIPDEVAPQLKQEDA